MNALFGVDFFGLILALWLTGGPGAILVAMVYSYAVETWLIRDRAYQTRR